MASRARAIWRCLSGLSRLSGPSRPSRLSGATGTGAGSGSWEHSFRWQCCGALGKWEPWAISARLGTIDRRCGAGAPTPAPGGRPGALLDATSVQFDALDELEFPLRRTTFLRSLRLERMRVYSSVTDGSTGRKVRPAVSLACLVGPHPSGIDGSGCVRCQWMSCSSACWSHLRRRPRVRCPRGGS